MKIIFDIDGTLTDFNKYIEKYALPWFKKYIFNVVNPNGLELEDILDLKNEEKLLDKYWISFRGLIFLLNQFRPGAAGVIRKMKSVGFEVEFYTARNYTTEKNIVGLITRFCTKCQLYLNGILVRKSQIYYFENDTEKIQKIISIKPQLVFDDKPENLKEMNKYNIPIICVVGKHNKQIRRNEAIEYITEYNIDTVHSAMNRVIGKKRLVYEIRAAKSEKLWKKLGCIFMILKMYFRPIVLNEDKRIDTEDAVIYVPNHRSTLDPLALSAIIKEEIHWAALLRFFEGKDSIFNNSKNRFLCCLTAYMFKKLEFFPIDRIMDNPKANNLNSIKDMMGFLKMHKKIGIFAEGTTKRDKDSDFGKFDDSFIILAQKSDAWIQPITVYWKSDRRKQIVINFGEAFKATNMKREDAMKKFMKIQKECLKENIESSGDFISE